MFAASDCSCARATVSQWCAHALQAFSGAAAVFLMTLTDVFSPDAFDKELQQGRNAIDAARKVCSPFTYTYLLHPELSAVLNHLQSSCLRGGHPYSMHRLA